MESSGSAPPTTAATLAKPRTRCSWNPEERAEWVRLLEESGQSLSEFCRDNDLHESTVSLWRRQLRGGQSGPSDEGVFVEVRLPESMGATAPELGCGVPVVVHLPGSVRLEVPVGTDLAWLADLVRALRAASL